jgi:putative PIN family toxin of toxin-antitoxin system
VLEVTADSNIYISALVFAGRPLQFLDAARGGVFSLAISEALLDEVHRVLRDKFGWSKEALDEAAASIGDFTRRVRPSEAIDAVMADPDDNRVLECAVAAASQFIVTGDGDLLRLGSYRAIQILRVADFMELISPD